MYWQKNMNTQCQCNLNICCQWGVSCWWWRTKWKCLIEVELNGANCRKLLQFVIESKFYFEFIFSTIMSDTLFILWCTTSHLLSCPGSHKASCFCNLDFGWQWQQGQTYPGFFSFLNFLVCGEPKRHIWCYTSTQLFHPALTWVLWNLWWHIGIGHGPDDSRTIAASPRRVFPIGRS